MSLHDDVISMRQALDHQRKLISEMRELAQSSESQAKLLATRLRSPTAWAGRDADSVINPHISAYSGDMRFIVPFLREGGTVSHSDPHGDTILHAAASGWQHRMVQFLILTGADVNAQNKDGDTALHAIIRSRAVPSPAKGQWLRGTELDEARRATFIELFIGSADRTIKNVQGASPLHLAAHEGDLFAIDLLLLAGSEAVDLPSSKGATALALAILEEHVECARRLLMAGADPNIELVDGIRPADLLHSSEIPGLKCLCDLIDS